MPKLVHANPRYRKHRASGQAIVTLAGKDHYLGLYGSKASRDEYDRLIGEWLANGRETPRAAVGADLYIAELLNAYRKHADSYYAASEGKSTGELDGVRAVVKLMGRLYGRTLCDDFGPLALKALRQAMVEHGWCRSYINAQAGRIRRIFKWGVGQEMVSPTVLQALQAVDGLRRGKTEAHESCAVNPVPEAIVEATRNHVNRHVRGMIDLQLITGMRPGEVCIMRGCDIDTTGKLWIYRPESHKTAHRGHRREIFMGPRAKAIVEQFWKPNLQAYLFSPVEAEAERRAALHEQRKTPLSCGNTIGTNRSRKPKRPPGERYDVAAYRRAIARACDDAFPPSVELARKRVVGKKGRAMRKETDAEWQKRLGPERWTEVRKWNEDHRWHPHQLRHTAGTKLRKEFGLEAAQVILGHKTLTVTQVYAEKNVAAAQQVMAAIG